MNESDNRSAEIPKKKGHVEALQIFVQELKPKMKVVYVPCGSDTSARRALPESRVICVDDSTHLENDPGDVDIVLLFDAPDTASRYSMDVPCGGYLLCDDRCYTATEMKNDGNFILKGIILERDGEFVFDSVGAHEYWSFDYSDEDMRRVNPKGFETAQKVVRRVRGDVDNVLDAYGAIAFFDSFAKKSLSAEEYFLSRVIPRKKGNMDAVFIFQRIKSI